MYRPTSLHISRSSQVNNHIALFSLSRVWRLGCLFNIHVLLFIVNLSALYLGQVIRKWNSSSMLFRLHILQSLSCGSFTVPLRDSMFKGWELILIWVMADLMGEFSMLVKYFSIPKLNFSLLYVRNLLSPRFLGLLEVECNSSFQCLVYFSMSCFSTCLENFLAWYFVLLG